MSNYRRAGHFDGGSATYSATANFGNGQATGQGLNFIDTYPARWMAVQVTGLGAGSAVATFGVRFSNIPAAGSFVAGTLQDVTATTSAMSSAIQNDTTIFHGPVKARYVQFCTVSAATAGAGTTATAHMTLWDTPGQTIG